MEVLLQWMWMVVVVHLQNWKFDKEEMGCIPVVLLLLLVAVVVVHLSQVEACNRMDCLVVAAVQILHPVGPDHHRQVAEEASFRHHREEASFHHHSEASSPHHSEASFHCDRGEASFHQDRGEAFHSEAFRHHCRPADLPPA